MNAEGVLAMSFLHRKAKKVNKNNLLSYFYFQNTSNQDETCKQLNFLF